MTYIPCYQYVNTMIKNGFYFVVFQGTSTIARCINNKWTMCGNKNIYEYDDFDNIDEVNCVYYC